MFFRSVAPCLGAFAISVTPVLAQETAGTPAVEDSSAVVWMLLAGVLGITAVIAALAIYFDRKRTAKLQAAVQALGGTFRAKGSPEEKQLLAATKWPVYGGRSIRNVIEFPQSEGVRMTLFDFMLASGKSGSEHTATRIQSPGVTFPAFDLRPELVAMKLASVFGAQDIDLEGAPKFNSMFRLRGDDEAAVRGLFNPAVVQYCEQHAGLRIFASGESLLFFRQQQRARPDKLAEFVRQSQELAALLLSARDASPRL